MLQLFSRPVCPLVQTSGTMAARLGDFLVLSACLLLACQTWARNEAPCQHSRWNKGFNTFLQRHLLPGTPTSLDQNQWKRYILNKTGCGRPTQSFLNPNDLARVKEVCSKGGGERYKDNLCISRQPFTFITVRSEMGTCGIKSIREETKHLILACEVLGNDCLPVHFEGNPENLKPRNDGKGCQDPQVGGRAPSTNTLWLCWVSLLLLFLCGF